MCSTAKVGPERAQATATPDPEDTAVHPVAPVAARMVYSLSSGHTIDAYAPSLLMRTSACPSAESHVSHVRSGVPYGEGKSGREQDKLVMVSNR